MKRCISILVVGFFLLLALSTFSLAKEIKVLSVWPMSGIAGSYPEFGWGFVDGMEYVNKQGGVNGKQIKSFVEDNRYDVPTGVAIFTRYAASEPADELLMATGYMTGVLKALIDKVNKEQKIAWIDGSYDTEVFGPEGGPSKYPYYFSLGATYGDQVRVLLRWIKGEYKGEGNPKIAIVYSPTEWGRSPLAMGRAYAKEIGVDIVSEEEITFKATDVTTQVTNVRRSGAKYVIFHGFGGGTAVTPIFLKTAKQYLKAAVILGTHYTTGVTTFLSSGEAVDGMIGAACRPMVYETDNPAVKLSMELAKEHKREPKDLFPYMEGVTYAIMVREALTRADNAGELNREGVKKALENMTWDFLKMFGGKTFSFKAHTIPMVRIYKAHAKDQKWLPISDWINIGEEFK